MPFYKVYIHIEKDVYEDGEKAEMLRLADVYRYLEIKETVQGLNVAFDVTVDVNDFGELGLVFNFHRDYRNFQKPLTNFFDTTKYEMEEEKAGLKVEVSITLVDKKRVPFSNLSKGLIGTCIIIEDYAQKCMETPHGMIFDRTSKNDFFEVQTVIQLNKKDCV
jgi:hypothetical protein